MGNAKVKPIEVKVGNVVVKIYRRTRVKKDQDYSVFEVADYSSGTRKFISLADEQEARDRANGIATKLANREGAMLAVTPKDWATYTRAQELLQPTGVPLELAAAEYAEARLKLGGRSLLEAVGYFVRRQPTAVSTKTVSEVYAELLAAKGKDGDSAVYLKDLKYRAGMFAKDFQRQIGAVSEPEINEWLRGLDGSPRSRNNVRDAVRILFGFAVSVGYLPKDHIDFERVAKAKGEAGEVEIFTPTEMAQLLNAAREERVHGPSQWLVPFVALGGFAGLRTAEIERQVWSDVMLDRGFIRVTGAKGNTAQKRLVPITPNLAKWLAPYWRKGGRCWDYGRTADAIGRLAGWAGMEWKHNALRHSFGSYRLALVQDPAKVAYEMGNSPRMIVRHYRELVLPAEAETWFGIEPPADGKVIVMPGPPESAGQKTEDGGQKTAERDRKATAG